MSIMKSPFKFHIWGWLWCYISLCGSVEDGKFTVFAPKKIFNNSTYKIGLIGDMNSKNAPPPLKLSFNCRLTEGNVTTWEELPIGEYDNFDSSDEIIETYQTDNLFVKPYESCSVVASHMITNEVYDQFPVKLMSKYSEDSKGTSIFIQLDKPAYKPKDVVRMRILTLNEKNLPTSSIPLTLIVKDSMNITIIKAINEFTVTKNGIRKFELPLAERLNLGTWTLRVKSKEVKKEIKFSVQEYVLPKFLVKVTPPPFVIIGKTGTIKVEIEASYTYGRSLAGNCSVIMFAEGQKIGQTPKTGDLKNGRIFFQFDAPTSVGEYKIEANVSESKTGRWYLGKSSLYVYETEPFKITWINPVNTFKPGFPLDLQLAISTIDNLPQSDTDTTSLTIKTKFQTRRPGQPKQTLDSENLRSAIQLNGIATVRIQTPSDSSTEFHSITVKYKDSVLKLPVPRPFQSTSKLYLSLSQQQHGINKVQRENSYTFDIVANQAVIRHVSYIFYGGDDVIATEANKIVSNVPAVYGRLDVTIPQGFYTNLKLFVFFIHHFTGADGEKSQEFVSASTTLETNNYIDLHLSEKLVMPADNVSFTIRTHPNSTIGLRVIDQSVLLLAPSNTEDDLVPAKVPYNQFWRASQSPEDSSMSSSDFIADFTRNGIGILTNAKSDKDARKKQKYNKIIGRVSRQADAAVDRPGIFDYKFNTGEWRTRIEFPEVWIYEEMEAENETTIFQPKVLNVPDTMTSWYATAFSINEKSGLAVTSFPEILQVFRPFFVTLNLPYSVIKHETFVLQVLVHNYLEDEVWANVTFINNKVDFQFVDTVEQKQENVKRFIRLPPRTVDVVKFVITPLKVGQLPIHIRAVTEQAGDALKRPLNVIAAGELQPAFNHKIMVRSNSENNFQKTETIRIRNRRSVDSQSLTFTGDTLAPILDLNEGSKVNKLITLPVGCGEQNMKGFYPNIIALDYLHSLHKLTSTQRTTGIVNLNKGYQEQVKFYDPVTGSFKYHLVNTKTSTWLTAFILRCFAGARKYITVDDKVLINGLKFLASKQNPGTGEFVEYGKLLHPVNAVTTHYGLAGGIERKDVGQNIFRYAITAYVTLAMSEIFAEVKSLELLSQSSKRDIEDAIVKGLNFISKDSSYTECDAYSLAIVTATLYATDHPAKDRFFEKLETFAKYTDDGLKHYEINALISEPATTPMSIEITGYALLSQLWKSNDAFKDSLPTVKWLLSKRNDKGGFMSTQDTFVALTALSKYARLTVMKPTDNMDIEITTDVDYTMKLNINPRNARSLQDCVLPKGLNSFNVTFKGEGHCYMEYEEHKYRTKRSKDDSTFIIDSKWMKPDENSDDGFHLQLCVSSVNEDQTGDVVAEVNLPTGYAFDEEGVTSLLEDRAKSVVIGNMELKDQATRMNIYYDYLNQTVLCVNLPVDVMHQVASKYKAKITVYEYMNTNNKGVILLAPGSKKTVCDLCLETDVCDIVNGCK